MCTVRGNTASRDFISSAQVSTSGAHCAQSRCNGRNGWHGRLNSDSDDWGAYEGGGRQLLVRIASMVDFERMRIDWNKRRSRATQRVTRIASEVSCVRKASTCVIETNKASACGLETNNGRASELEASKTSASGVKVNKASACRIQASKETTCGSRAKKAGARGFEMKKGENMELHRTNADDNGAYG